MRNELLFCHVCFWGAFVLQLGIPSIEFTVTDEPSRAYVIASLLQLLILLLFTVYITICTYVGALKVLTS